MELRTTLDPGFMPLRPYLVPQPIASPTTRTDTMNEDANASAVRDNGAKMNCMGISRTGQKNNNRQT